ncbi:MAG: protein kinase [Chloroflexota bacterium]
MNHSPDGDTPTLDTRRVLGGRYVVLDKIGEGGAAEVYRARDQRLDRIVAVKILRPQFSYDEASRKRFLIEARAAAGLNHPNIVDIYDFGEAPDGSMFIAMQYVEGRNLKDVLHRKGRLSAGEVVAIIPQVCHALTVAHANDLVHRDVKPQNIMIDDKGNVRLTDFGIVKALSGPELTQTGMTFGTAAYLSPEQATGDPIGPASDIYALGCVMYEMLSGAPPFTGDNPAVVAYKQVWEQPRPLHDRTPEVLPSLEAIVMRCLNKDPNRRYPSTESLAADLANLGTAFNQPTQAVVLNAMSSPAMQPDSAPILLQPGAETSRPIPMPAAPEHNAVPPVRVQTTGISNQATRRVYPDPPMVASAGGTGGGGGSAASRMQVVGAGVSGRGRASNAWLPLTLVVVALGLSICGFAAWQQNVFGIFSGSATPTPPSVVAATATGTSSTGTGAEATATIFLTATSTPTAEASPTETATETPTESPTDTPEPTIEVPPTATVEPAPLPTDTPAPGVEPAPTVDSEPPTVEPLPLPPDPTPQPGQFNSVTFDAYDFHGGYTNAAGYHGRTAQWVYGLGTAYSSMSVGFTVDEKPNGPGTLNIVGIDSEDEAKTPVRISVNNSVIYEGPNPLPNDNTSGSAGPGNWGTVTFRLNPKILKQGENTITITNLDPSDKVNYPLFVMIDSVTITW